MNQIKSQIYGLLLALATAIGCIFYEKIVHNFSFLFFLVILSIEVLALYGVAFLFFKNDLLADMQKFTTSWDYSLWSVGYIATGITTVFWFVITKHQGVMIGSIYEVKYIVILAIIYILFGDNKFTLNTFIGLVFALTSIYFISKK